MPTCSGCSKSDSKVVLKDGFCQWCRGAMAKGQKCHANAQQLKVVLDGKPNCQACGACCWAMDETPYFCNVTLEEAKELGAWGRKHIIEIPWNDPYAWVGTYGAIKTRWRTMQAGPLKGREILTCEALQGSVLHQVKCSIYEKRPAVCRETLRPGDRACLKFKKTIAHLLDEAALSGLIRGQNVVKDGHLCATSSI